MPAKKKYTWGKFGSDALGVLLIVLGIYMLTMSQNEFAVKLLSVGWGDKSFSLVGLLVVVGVLILIVPRGRNLIDVWVYFKEKKSKIDGK